MKTEGNKKDKDLEFLDAEHSNIARPLLGKIISFSKVNNAAILTRPATEGVTEKFLKSEEDLGKHHLEQKEGVEYINGKPFEIKAKSSPYAPLNSAVPYDPALSKSSGDFDEIRRHTDEALEKYKADKEKLIREEKVGTLIDYLYKDNAKHNGHELLYVKNENGDVVKTDKDGNITKSEQEGQPLFIAKDPKNPEKFLKYDPKTNDFTTPYIPQDKVTIHNVEIIYAKFLYKDEVLEREMTETEQKVANIEQQLTDRTLEQRQKAAKIKTRVEIIESTPKIVKTDIDQFANSVIKTLPESHKPLNGKDHAEIVKNMVNEEKSLFDYHSKITTYSNIGITNGNSEAIAVALSKELKGMIYHAEETNRPHVFEPDIGKFEVILPEGPLVANVKTEQGAVKLINHLNKEKGTSIQPNPEWGWVKDQATGEYRVPEVKFPWKEMYQKVKECDLHERKDQEELIKIKIEIERLRLYPNVNYDNSTIRKQLEEKFSQEMRAQLIKAKYPGISDHDTEKMLADDKKVELLREKYPGISNQEIEKIISDDKKAELKRDPEKGKIEKIVPEYKVDEDRENKMSEGKKEILYKVDKEEKYLKEVEKEVNAKLNEHIEEKIREKEQELTIKIQEFHDKYKNSLESNLSILEKTTSEYNNRLSGNKENIVSSNKGNQNLKIKSLSVAVNEVNPGGTVSPTTVKMGAKTPTAHNL